MRVAYLPNAQALSRWSSSIVHDQEKSPGYPKRQNQLRSNSKTRMTYCRLTSWCRLRTFRCIIYMHTYPESLWRFWVTLLRSNIVTGAELPKAASSYTHVQRIHQMDVNNIHNMSWRCSFPSPLKLCTSYGCRWCWWHDSKARKAAKAVDT